MFKYAKIINEITGECEVGLGTNEANYVMQGMTLLDVTQSDLDNNYYLTEMLQTEEYEEEQTQKRENEFKTNFFEIAPIEGLFTGGWYRRVPKGYTSAIESLNTAFNAVTVLGKLPANTLTFYTAPDFADAEQCTEDWLVANAFKNAEMTTTEFGAFYATFLQAWNATEH